MNPRQIRTQIASLAAQIDEIKNDETWQQGSENQPMLKVQMTNSIFETQKLCYLWFVLAESNLESDESQING